MLYSDDEKIKAIINKNVFDELSTQEKNILWTNRYNLSQKPQV